MDYSLKMIDHEKKENGKVAKEMGFESHCSWSGRPEDVVNSKDSEAVRCLDTNPSFLTS